MTVILPAPILIAGSDSPLRRMITLNLHLEGYAIQVTNPGPQVLERILTTRPALVLLDVRLPHVKSVQITHQVRQRSAVPLLLLMQREHTQEQWQVLCAGADGYLTIPLTVEDLTRQVRLLLGQERGGPESPSQTSLTVGHLRIEAGASRVWKGQQEVTLTPVEARLFSFLIHHAGQIMSSETLLHQIWGATYLGEAHLLLAYVERLRAKLEEDPFHPRYLQSQAGIGYVLTA